MVFLGEELWLAYGIIPAQIPSIVEGSISRCECSGVNSSSNIAMYAFSSSSASMYSIIPSCIKSNHFSLPCSTLSMILSVSLDFPFSTMTTGLRARPGSVKM